MRLSTNIHHHIAVYVYSAHNKAYFSQMNSIYVQNRNISEQGTLPETNTVITVMGLLTCCRLPPLLLSSCHCRNYCNQSFLHLPETLLSAEKGNSHNKAQ